MLLLHYNQISIQSTDNLVTLDKSLLLSSSVTLLKFSYLQLLLSHGMHAILVSSWNSVWFSSGALCAWVTWPIELTVIRAREGSVVGESNLVLVPVLCSATEASRVPLTSVSRGTWIWDMPQGVGGSPTCGFDLPQQFRPLATPLYPSATWMCTCSWLSETVMEVCLLETAELCFT